MRPLETVTDAAATATATAAPSEGSAWTGSGSDPAAETAAGDRLLGTTIDRYRVETRLGAGGMGVVYAAYDPALDRRVALKVLPAASESRRADLETRLRREAQALARLVHPNVVTVHDVGVAAESVYVAMQLVDGVTLDRWLDAVRRTPGQILDVFVAAAAGLRAAHAAGIIHRDFKPSNVMIDSGGRAYVGDFGLARSADEPVDSTEVTTSLLDERITHAGTVMGTPLFMAPEQHRGEPADARADQFAFCVSLWRSLFGAHPFGVDPARLEAMTRDDVREPPRAAGVPPRVLRALRRGLRHDPAARWPSMEALAAELRPRSRAPWIFAGVTVAGIAAAVMVTAQVAGVDRVAAQPPCQGAGASLDGIWDPARAEALRSAFAAARPGWGADVAARVSLALDRYAGRWVEAHADACEATHVRSEQSSALLDLRMQCLDRRLVELDARVDALLDAPDAATVIEAQSVVAALPPLEACADASTLTAAVPPPTEPARRAEADALARELADATAQAELGRLEPAVARLDAIAARSQALGYAPVEARRMAVLAELTAQRGSMADAHTLLSRAMRVAAEARDDAAMARIALWELRVAVFSGAEADDVETYRNLADALIVRAGDPAGLRGKYEDYVGISAGMAGRTEEAIAHGERAIALFATVEGGGFSRAAALTNLATSHLDARHHAVAATMFREAVAVMTEATGEEHPDVAAAMQNLGVLLSETGDDSGIALIERARAIYAATLGADHPHLVDVDEQLATAYAAAGRLDDASRVIEPAYATAIARLPAHHADLMGVTETLGEIRARRGDSSAIAILEEGIAITERAHDVPNTAAMLVTYAQALRRLGRAADARVAAGRSLTLAETAGRAELAAIARLEQAWARYQLGDRVRAVPDARTARATLTPFLPGLQRVVAEYDAWLAEAK